MDNVSTNNEAMANAGLPYDDINWYNIEGQPFGSAVGFNVIVFNDANNIIDTEGPVAIGGSFYSSRGLSVGFPKDESERDRVYSPDLVRFLVGRNVSMGGPLVVIGHVVAGGGFRAASGSSYLIGKDGMTDGIPELKFLYQAGGGSLYWTPVDKGNHYVVPSYDVPRYIPEARIGANLPRFFNSARESIGSYKGCIEGLAPNGSVIDNNHEWILRGNDPVQNVFLIDVRPNGLINKGIRAEVPPGSTVIVKLRTGVNAHLQYGVYGERSKANETLYVFEDATNIYMEKSSDIWGSILAPQAMFHAHPTGGHVSGNAALRSFAVNNTSGFEFHYFPFRGGVICQATAPAAPTPAAPIPPAPAPAAPAPTAPAPSMPMPSPIAPVPSPIVPAPGEGQILSEGEEQVAGVCPECPACPVPMPCPTCPTPVPCPIQAPCPTCPTPEPCPIPAPCPICPTPEPCPIPAPCPACPTPEPCPVPAPCPVCPTPEPCPTPLPCPEYPEPEPCPECEECLIQSGVIVGCILGCRCGSVHEWEVRLCQRFDDVEILLSCVRIDGCGCFQFEVPYEGCYVLRVKLSENCWKTFRCKPIITLKNIGVADFIIE